MLKNTKKAITKLFHYYLVISITFVIQTNTNYHKMANNLKALEMYKYYQTGLSLEDVGKIYGITRQSVHASFKCRGFELRKKKTLPFIIVDGLKFTIRYDGYYYCTTNDTLPLHKHNWIKKNGEIPSGYQLHHKDQNKLNNNLENLQLLTVAEHTKLHSKIYNGSPNNKKVICRNTGEIYHSMADAERKNGIRKGYLRNKINKNKTINNLKFDFYD